MVRNSLLALFSNPVVLALRLESDSDVFLQAAPTPSPPRGEKLKNA